MKNIKKIIVITMLLVILTGMAAVTLAACNQPSAKDGTFVLEVRKFNDANALGVVNTNGELLASKTIKVKEGQMYVSDALAVDATLKDGVYTLTFSDTDYLTFSETWWLTGGNMSKETRYITEDYTYSYIAANGTASSGPTADLLDGLTVYTIVVDGWDGEIGTTKPYVG